jgi:glycosyltransferase involved in cell wall biosynthesis
MKLAFVHQPLGTLPVPATMGSIEVLTYELARRLASFCEVIVYSRKGPDQSISEARERVHYERVTTRLDDICLRHPRLKRLPGFRNPKRPLFASAAGHLEYSLKVARGIRRQHCDWVHIHNFSQIVPVVRALNPKAKIALHMNCEWATQLHAPVIRRRLQKCDLIIGCSEFITSKIRHSFPEVASRCRTVFNGVDVNTFVPDESRSRRKGSAERLLFVGRIWPDKGPHVLLEAFKKVVKVRPEVQVELVGWKTGPAPEFVFLLSDDEKVLDMAPLYRGDYYEHLREILPQHLRRQVSIQDALPHRELAEHYRIADVFIGPSVWNEPFGMVIVEAMASGLPVIATRGGGFPEIIKNGETGLLTERNDAVGLAEAIINLLENDELRESMGSAGRKRALQLFTWDKISDHVLRLYQEFMESESSREAFREKANVSTWAPAGRGQRAFWTRRNSTSGRREDDFVGVAGSGR